MAGPVPVLPPPGAAPGRPLPSSSGPRPGTTQETSVGILVFDGVEELDFVGPWEVFGCTARLFPGSVRAILIGPRHGTVVASYGLRCEPEAAFPGAPRVDVLVVPGGPGARAVAKDPVALAYLRAAYDRGATISSVCTGALVLAAAGLLRGRRATTHWAALDELRAFDGVVVEHRKVIDEGRVVTAAGISSGIDLALHLVARLVGPDPARTVAKRMEYDWSPPRSRTPAGRPARASGGATGPGTARGRRRRRRG